MTEGRPQGRQHRGVPCSPLATANWPPRVWADRRWDGDNSEALAVNTRAPEAPAKGAGLVLLTLASGQSS